MMTRDRRLEVIDHLRRARGPRTRHVLRLLRRTRQLPLRIVPAVRFARGYSETRNQQHDPMRRQVGKRINFLATSKTECGAAGQKERDVGADVRSDIREL